MNSQGGENLGSKSIKQRSLELSNTASDGVTKLAPANGENNEKDVSPFYGSSSSYPIAAPNGGLAGEDRKSIRSSLGGDNGEIWSQQPLNEPLLGGFALLRVVQLLNFDIYYIGLDSRSDKAAMMSRLGDLEAAAKLQEKSIDLNQGCASPTTIGTDAYNNQTNAPPSYYKTFLDDLSQYNPFQKYIDRFSLLNALCKFLKICLSLSAIMFGFDKFISTIILCLSTKIDSPETSNSGMGLFVLILVNFSSMFILSSTVFNGHLLWNLFSKRLFLVSRRFQYKTMLCLLIFVYLEYIINISFVNNLYDWDFISNNIQSGSYSVLANLRIIVTEQDEEHYYVDILLTIIQFARGAIRISPYITINYAIICLKEHIHTIRNQHLLTDSLKKRQKLRVVVAHRKGVAKSAITAPGKKKRVNFVTNAPGEVSNDTQGNNQTSNGQEPLVARVDNNANNIRTSSNSQQRGQLKKPSNGNSGSSSPSQNLAWRPTLPPGADENVTSIPISFIGSPLNGGSESELKKPASTANIQPSLQPSAQQQRRPQSQTLEREVSFADSDQQSGTANSTRSEDIEKLYLTRIRDFDELESYITNLYIFIGKLNRFMSRQGLTIFFIVHNLVISVSVIVPEAVRGGIFVAYLVRFLVVLIGFAPFAFGQQLNSQLEQLSKQIDRIIIQQQFIHRRRDNLVRIRELVHEIRVNCGGMINFNVETGIKYLVVAFASAFFIEQERKYNIFPLLLPTN